MLLFTTLFRISLNVSSTKLILKMVMPDMLLKHSENLWAAVI